MNPSFLQQLFYCDALGMLMTALIGTIGLTVAFFASQYMDGARNYGRFFIVLLLLVLCLIGLVSADHIILFIVLWMLSNLLLVMLMSHKQDWPAARASGWVALQHLLCGSVALCVGLFLLYYATGQTSIYTLTRMAVVPDYVMYAALVCVLVAACAQSALLPFHRWLLSSLNSPTPVSAFMHAGLVNGGGFLLTRFAPLYAATPGMLLVMFLVGSIAAIMGTIWKLMQHDVKRTLACSTVGQMGFMVMQCGLGLFPAAIAHVCWHGMFKAYLFLNSASTAQEKRYATSALPSYITFVLSLVCGVVGSYTFAYTSGKVWLSSDTSFFLVCIAFIGGSHAALSALRDHPVKRFPFLVCIIGLLGALYGSSVLLLEHFLEPFYGVPMQQLNAVHIGVLISMVCIWLTAIFCLRAYKTRVLPVWLVRLYVWMLNASQPDARTITTHRNDYQF